MGKNSTTVSTPTTSTTTTRSNDDASDDHFVILYRKRLHIDDSVTLPPNCWETLCLLTERHLAHLPFENLSLHTITRNNNKNNSNKKNKELGEDGNTTCAHAVVAIEKADLIQKLLIDKRGGCCLELNGLLAHLLQTRTLGYTSVHLVPCFVAAGRERGNHGTGVKFRTRASHFVLLVNGLYIVDVGLGEPPLHPLRYVLDEIQTTPEGMKSRIRWDPRGTWTDGQGNQRTCVIQEWFVERNDGNNGTRTSCWEPRLQWDIADAPLPPSLQPHSVAAVPTTIPPPPPSPHRTLQSFAYVIDLLTHPKSSFARKLVVCRLTALEKITLIGGQPCRLKITSPRSGPQRHNVREFHLESQAQVVETLQTYFDISLPMECYQLDLDKSCHANNTKLWHHL